MRIVPLSDLPEDAVTIDGDVARFSLPNPHDPDKPLTGSLTVVEGAVHVFDERSSLGKRFLNHHGL